MTKNVEKQPRFKNGDFVQVSEPTQVYSIKDNLDEMKLEVESLILLGTESLLILEAIPSKDKKEITYKVLDSETQKEFMISEDVIGEYDEEIEGIVLKTEVAEDNTEGQGI